MVGVSILFVFNSRAISFAGWDFIAGFPALLGYHSNTMYIIYVGLRLYQSISLTRF
jgi:hypothetical protein